MQKTVIDEMLEKLGWRPPKNAIDIWRPPEETRLARIWEKPIYEKDEEGEKS